jgi:chemotaxis signal transduction protein
MRHVLPVRIDATWFALDALDVEEILTPPSCVPLPAAPPRVVGVLRWRERALAVIDIGDGAEGLAPGAVRSRVVVVRPSAGGEAIALPVSAVREVREASAADPQVFDVAALLHALGADAVGDPPVQPLRSGSSGGAVHLVVISGSAFDCAMMVDVVRSIGSPRDWADAEPLDLKAIVQAPPGRAGQEERILVIDAAGAGRRVALRVGGEISFRELEASRLLPLPAVFQAPAAHLVDRVAFFDGQRPLLLLNPAVLGP